MTSSNDAGSCNCLDRCSDAKCPYVHYVHDDTRANEESALCLRRDRLDIMPKLNPDEMRRVLSTTGPLLPISAIQADLRGFALEKVCGGGGGDSGERRSKRQRTSTPAACGVGSSAALATLIREGGTHGNC